MNSCFSFLVSRFSFLVSSLVPQPETRNQKPAPRSRAAPSFVLGRSSPNEKRETRNEKRKTLAFSRLLLTFLTASALALAAPPPKLVLAIVIDQFRYDYLLRFRADYRSGLARLLDKGAVFTDAHYLHAATVTAVGHGTFLTGATPSISGIIANEWYDRESGQTVTSVSDPATKLVGGTADRAGSSPRRLLVSTVGDELKIQRRESKVIGISIKDRSAILPAGHMADGAYWYDDHANAWVTSTYYRDELPEWAKNLNQEQPAARYAGAKWLPFDAKGDSGKPFCGMTKDSGVRFCGSLEATPWGNEMIEEFAERALEGENLGRRGATDITCGQFLLQRLCRARGGSRRPGRARYLHSHR